MLFTGVWHGSKYGSESSFVFEIKLAIDDFSLNVDLNDRIKIIKNWNYSLLEKI